MAVDIKSRYLGCMLGLAVGDALGAPIEFMTLDSIKARFGPRGLVEPAGPLMYTDDTQMSLATAVGCLGAWNRYEQKGIAHPPSLIYYRYLDWLKTQDDPAERRAPGHTCLSALESGKPGTIEEPINNSKGCGGVMRTAPIGLAFHSSEGQGAFRIGAEAAALTHGHPSGYLTAGFLAEMIAHIITGCSLEEAVGKSTEQLVRYEGHAETLAKVEEARALVASDLDVEMAIKELGEGWVGEEALGISIYCALKFPNDWRAAVLAAVNHSGDSDSTGSICGAILGAYLGLEAIPAEWVRTVENGSAITKLAEALYRSSQKGESPDGDEYPGI